MMILAGGQEAVALAEVPVCVDLRPAVTGGYAAARTAEKIFAEAGIGTKWYRLVDCPARTDVIRITFESDRPETFRPRAMAYAFPYEGSHIVVMLDRVRAFADSTCQGSMPKALAYVMSHEIGHILQGLAQHSDTGIMKASFGRTEAFQMTTLSLRFAPIDLELMQIGMEKRQEATLMTSTAR